ncbi:MAG: hypothetical protein IT448_11205 [Phycisphaerales bacterium]|nr:hypothetical protein [Phycisphaerales bacterium]
MAWVVLTPSQSAVYRLKNNQCRHLRRGSIRMMGEHLRWVELAVATSLQAGGIGHQRALLAAGWLAYLNQSGFGRTVVLESCLFSSYEGQCGL